MVCASSTGRPNCATTARWCCRSTAPMPRSTRSQEVLFELGEIVERLGIDPPKAVVFRSAQGNGFIAGADIREFQQFDARAAWATRSSAASRCSSASPNCPAPRPRRSTVSAWAAAPNLALACRYRAASNDASTRIGLPEVKLGIFPAGAAACACRAWSARRRRSTSCSPGAACRRRPRARWAWSTRSSMPRCWSMPPPTSR